MNPPKSEWCAFVALAKKQGMSHITIPIDVAEEVFPPDEAKAETKAVPWIGEVYGVP